MTEQRGTSTGPVRRSYLKACASCRRFCLTLPYRDDAGRTFCTDACLRTAHGFQYFCPACLKATTDESPGSLVNVGLIGEVFLGSGRPCSECGSVVRRKWFTVFLIPIRGLRTYRVIYMGSKTFHARRLRAAQSDV